MAKRPKVDNFPRGYNVVQFGKVVAPATSAAVPIAVANAQAIKFAARLANTDTVWINNTITATSGTGFPLFGSQLTILELPMAANSLTFYVQSQGGSSVVDYVVYGFAP